MRSAQPPTPPPTRTYTSTLRITWACSYGGILSPLLANIALDVLDEHLAEAWKAFGNKDARQRRRRRGQATYRLIRYADDFVVMVAGARSDAETLQAEVAAVLAPIGLRLSEEKTKIVHIDDGFDFLGFCIQRQTKRGSDKRFVYTWPAKKALASIKAKVKAITRQGTNQSLPDLLRQLNPALRGWTTYFRHGVSKATFGYLGYYTWHRVVGWLRRKYDRANWKHLRRHYLGGHPGWWPEQDGVRLFSTQAVPVTRYRYRGTKIPTPWTKRPAITAT
jgi:RNA-directed DNA polymerase